jgi:3-methyladenine DNA glycosylase AlkD
MMNLKDVLAKLKSLGKHHAKPGFRAGMARFCIVSDTALGIPIPELRKLAKEIKKEESENVRHLLALVLWKQNIHEAKILATMVDEADLVTEKQMQSWVNDFYSWDICDQCCSNLFDKTEFCEKKIFEWVKSEKEFVRRAGFVLMATSAVHDKEARDETFLAYLPIIERYSTDDRNFVKKAVNWALRQIGKRNEKLRTEALKLAKKLKESEDHSARWVGSDAIRELESEAVKKKLERN